MPAELLEQATEQAVRGFWRGRFDRLRLDVI